MVGETSACSATRSLLGRAGARTGCQLLLGATVCLAAGSARAAEPEPAELRQVVETALPAPEFSPSTAVGLRWARDTEWTRLTLAEPWQLGPEESRPRLRLIADLGGYDIRDSAWQATPYAATTVASAFAALATRGIPVFRETRDFRTVRTHRLGCYFKGRGGGVVWRLEF